MAEFAVTPWSQDLWSCDLAFDLACDLARNLAYDLTSDLPTSSFYKQTNLIFIIIIRLNIINLPLV